MKQKCHFQDTIMQKMIRILQENIQEQIGYRIPIREIDMVTKTGWKTGLQFQESKNPVAPDSNQRSGIL